MRWHSLSPNQAGVIGILPGLLLGVAVLGIVGVGWRVNQSVIATDQANANAQVVGATLRIYQNQLDNNTISKWQEFRDDTLGFVFKYPPTWGSARISTHNDDLFLILFDSDPDIKPKHFTGEIRATAANAKVVESTVARGFSTSGGYYYRKLDDRTNENVTAQLIDVVVSKAGRIVMYEDKRSAIGQLSALLNLKTGNRFSGLSFTYGSGYDKEDVANFKKVLQTFSYTR